jgi:hypothetical protein
MGRDMQPSLGKHLPSLSSAVLEDLKRHIPPVEGLDTKGPLIQGLWALEIAKARGHPRITADDICTILSEVGGICCKPIQLIRAFAKAVGKTKRHHFDGTYEIMLPGRRDLQQSVGSHEQTANIVFVSGHHAWSDSNEKVPRLLRSLTGKLLVVDRYYGFGSLHALSQFGHTRKIRYLTAELGKPDADRAHVFEGELRKFLKEFKNLEARKYPNPYELHDRYIIAANGLILIGHGLKDLGNKESFVVFINSNIAKAVMDNLKAGFEKRWRISPNL